MQRTTSRESLLSAIPSAWERLRVAELMAEKVPITWEILEDKGLFALFRRLPTPEDYGELNAIVCGLGSN